MRQSISSDGHVGIFSSSARNLLPKSQNSYDDIYLWSDRTFKDFELFFEARLKDGNGLAGVFVRGKRIELGKLTRIAGPQVDHLCNLWGRQSGDLIGLVKEAPAELISAQRAHGKT